MTAVAGPATLSAARVAVTGANGFIGANLCLAVAAAGADVVALVRPGGDVRRLDPVLDDITRSDFDLVGPDDACDVAVKDVDVVVHLAAKGVHDGHGDRMTAAMANVVGTIRALRIAERSGARFVYGGSCFEYGEVVAASEGDALAPATPYAASKASAGLLAHAFGRDGGLPVVWLRLFTAYGALESPERLIPYVTARCLDGEPTEVTSGDQTRDFVYVDDAVDAICFAATSPNAPGEILNVCTGVETSVREEAVELIIELTGRRSPAEFGSRPPRPNDIMRSSGNPEHTAQVLGWRASTPLEIGLQRTAAWLAGVSAR